MSSVIALRSPVCRCLRKSAVVCSPAVLRKLSRTSASSRETALPAVGGKPRTIGRHLHLRPSDERDDHPTKAARSVVSAVPITARRWDAEELGETAGVWPMTCTVIETETIAMQKRRIIAKDRCDATSSALAIIAQSAFPRPFRGLLFRPFGFRDRRPPGFHDLSKEIHLMWYAQP
jgi:hypothetical protein